MKKYSALIPALFMALAASSQTAAYLNPDLTAQERVDDLLSRLTTDEKISLMMDQSPAIERLGIAEYNWWNEALHGVGRAGLATVLPQSIGMAATWNDSLIYDAFNMVSDEARAKFNDFRRNNDLKRYHCLSFWTPNVNIFRDPRWGRGQETYGEDPYLTSRIGVAVVDGLQGRDPKWMKTLAGAKHFAVHSGPEWNRHTFDAHDIDPRDMRETYLPAFKKLVDAGVGQVMCAYNRYEGEPCCSSKKLLQQILRNEWGYDKIIVSDCWAIRDFISDWAHNTHPSGAAASADAVISGTDLECGPVYKDLGKALKEGLITEDQIDISLRKLLMARYEMGELFPDLHTPWDSLPLSVVDSEAHKALALDMARQSMTLLKNNGVLPLPKSGVKVLVAGPNAADSVTMWGNYNGFPSHTVTALEGIREYLPDAGYARGCDHVVSSSLVSAFNMLDGGLKACYWNTLTPDGDPVAEVTYSTPLNITTGGATVVAPGVNLNDFSARYEGRFVPAADGTYIIEIEADKGGQTLLIDGKVVASREAGGRNGHKISYMWEGHKGQPSDIVLHYDHRDDVAELKFDIKAQDKDNLDASESDVVIFVGGISPRLEGEEMKVSVPGFRGGDRETIELPAVQRALIRNLKEQGKKVVFVNLSGSAVAMSPEAEICDAILQAWYPGQAGGQAIAEVIFGDYNPSGRLPVTFYADDNQLPDFEDYSMNNRTYRYFTGTPLYPFGYGLSYTTFEYPEASLSASSMGKDDSVELTVKVANTGDRDGEEVVQIYVASDYINGPVKTLREFRRVPVKAGETASVSFTLSPEAFATFDNDTERMAVKPGRYNIYYGGSSADVTMLPFEITD
ncbi:MAG: glycoside hydrolase family 3 protein [Bacteroides sp.]|nr:glycoside hydrolase family 3 protein [Bacteroides sp.]